MKRGVNIILLFALVFFAACEKAGDKPQVVDLKKRSPIPRRNGVVDETPPFRIAIGAMISPRETVKVYGELAEYIGKKLGRDVEIIQRKTYSEINEMVKEESVDAAFVCSGPYVEGRREFGMEIVAAPVVNGSPLYHAYFIARKNSGIKGIEDLRGRRFAFTDPKSNTGALVPRYVISKMGETPETYFGSIIYTYSHDASIKAVSDGIVDAASVDSLIYDYYKRFNPSFVEKTEVVYRSPAYGIPPVVVNPKAPAVLKMKLREVLLGMDRDEEGRKILARLNIDRFVVPDESIYDSVREMEEWLRKR